MKSYFEYAHVDDENLTRYDVHDCPFCGSKDTDLYQTQVQCNRCDAHGPAVSDDFWHMAITLWNELPRKKGDELKQLRLHWSNLMRRVKRAEKIAEKALDNFRQKERAEKERRQEYSQWAKEREAWLRPREHKDTAQ